ncbi:MAG TPA: acyltransferase domain-containing protein, partial [Beijerinckia sp.]|nr:acyltransferase domain-containing protein [Beijerinckia sp.]
REVPVAFVYSGNGSQFAGMGRAAYAQNAAFKAHFDAADRIFGKLAGWSLAEELHHGELEQRLTLTRIAQPLLFAIQSATTHALKIEGLAPSFVFGHSVGEVAAAEAAGILDLENAVHVIHFRSLHQELTRDTGKMAVVFGSPETIELILAELPDLEIAASNSPRAYTLSGDSASLGRLSKVARAHKARVHPLDLAYPFHSKLMEPVQKPLIEDLSDIVARDSAVPFISTVEGEEISGVRLKADYWWRNVREPVRFMEAIRESARLGARIFIEIGPAATLLAHVKDTVEATHQTIASFSILDRKDQDGDPIKRGFARALAHGAKVDWDAAFGNDPGAAVPLASYPWQWQDYRLRESVEAAAIIRPAPWHPLIGARYSADSLEWHSVIDTLLVPQLADHQIDGQVVLPGSAFVEMAIAVARDWLGTDGATITDLEIFSPLHLSGEGSREISCRLTPALNFIEISSRPRLGHTPWQLHAVARIVKEAGAAAESATLPESDRKDIAGDELYAIARQAGLQFGPAFRNVASASRLPAEVIMVDLIAPTEASVFGLDPARLDSCFHGLILTFADLTGKDRRTAFVPVRFDEVRLVKPGTAIARARIDIVSCNERAIIANYVLVDEAGELVAILRGARYQAFRSSRQAELASHALYQRQILASEPTAARNDAALRADELRALGKNLLADSEAATASQSATLLEGWATAAAVALVRALGQKAGLDAESFAAAGLLPISAKSWFANLLAALESSGLLKRDATGLSLDESIALPEPDAILETIASDHPECSAELLLAASATVSLQRLSAGDLEALSAGIAGFAVDGFELGGDQPTHSASLLADLLQHSLASWPQDRALRILQIGYGPLSTRALSLARKSGARLTIFEPDRRRAGRARLGFRPNDGVELVEKLTEASGPFDLVIGVDALHRSLRDPSLWSSLRDLLSPGTVFCAIEPAPRFYRDLTFGLDPAWFEQTVSGQPLGAILSDKAWVQRIALAGLTDVISDTLSTPTGAAFLLTGQIADIALESHGSGKALIITDNFETGGAVAPPLARLLETSGLHTSLTPDSELDSFATGETPELIVYIASPMPAGLLPVEALTHQCLCLKRCVDRLALRKAKIWIVTGGGPEAGTESDIGVGLAAFSRTLANEFPMLEVHRVTIAPDLPLEDAAGRLRDLILSKTGETDIILRAQGTNVLRFEAPDVRGHAGQTIAEAARLERGEGAGTDRLHWAPTERQTPGPGEVEIAVEATGLNFRDVMFALGILPPSILENGFAGPTMGLECAGTVLRIGPEVAGFKPGNRVIAFARGGFATHVIVPAHVVALAPEGLSAATAATIPVAFLTAFYALVTCAHLKRREWVLIHGGAGGVGLAALQIAQWRGARVIATAGSPEKRALLKMLGAEHVFDSRSGAFVDDVRRATRDGVHVVLNSLSGEAMERSLGLLRPFGRFIELGKRDYVANTPIGLRPFRQNLSYFGVDLDQLILNDAKAGKKLFQNVMALFAKGILAPLPHRTFEAAEIGDAFRLMQQSHHIG